MEQMNRIKELSEELFPQMLDFCQRIVRIPSEPGKEETVAKVYLEELEALGYDKIFTDPWGNVTGIIEGTEIGPAILYNGHMDAVPAGDPSLWEGGDPYSGEIKNSLIYDKNMQCEEETQVLFGRGSADLKCGAAAQIYAGAILLRLRKEGFPVKGRFITSQVVLEENGEMLGTLKLLDHYEEKKIQVNAMVSCEPSGLRIILGHRGRMELRVTVHGKSCHGSSPWLGVNAVTKAAKLILEIEKAVWSNGHTDPDLGKSGIALTILQIEPCELCIVPNKCTMIYDRRLVPGETVEGAIAEVQEVIDRLAAEDPDFKAEVSLNANLRRSFTGQEAWIESRKEVWKIDRENPFVQACARGIERVGSSAEYGYWAYSTDIPALSDRGIPVIGYSGAQEFCIHTTDEKVRLDYLKESLAGNAAIFLEAAELAESQFHG